MAPSQMTTILQDLRVSAFELYSWSSGRYVLVFASAALIVRHVLLQGRRYCTEAQTHHCRRR